MKKENIFTELDYSSIDIARAIRYSGQQHGFKLDMTQINKILYLVYAAILVAKKERITKDSPIAGTYGPVFWPVLNNINLYDDISDKEYLEIKEKDGIIIEAIDSMVNRVGNIPVNQLVYWTRETGSPWESACIDSGWKWKTELNDKDIYNYFYPLISYNGAY